MNRRAAILVALAVAGVVALGAVALAGFGGGDDAPQLRAAAYPSPIPAPATTGVDADGSPVEVPRPGRPAVVTFLYANCPTVCPLVGTQIAAALDRVPAADRDAVDVVAISVDPKGDTPQAVRRFLTAHRLDGRMRYIIGSRAQLEPVWAAWGIVAQPQDETVIASVHTARVVLIDRQGDQLASYPGGLPIPPDDLAADISALAAG